MRFTATIFAVTIFASPGYAGCTLIGDSIAFEVARIVKECAVDAKSGLSSAQVIDRVHPDDVLFVSAGSNDWNNPRLEENLEAIRGRASARVVWISPAPPVGAAAVDHIASFHGDGVIHFEVSPDMVHPESYEALAEQIREFLR